LTGWIFTNNIVLRGETLKKGKILLISALLSFPLALAENQDSAIDYFLSSPFTNGGLSWILNGFIAILIFLFLLVFSATYISKQYKKGHNLEIVGIIIMNFFITLFLSALIGGSLL